MNTSFELSDEPEPMDQKKVKGFFAVDVGCFQYACEIGLNPAVAYLVLASGTGSDNVTTSWSVNAIENYTSISRSRARDAVQLLLKKGLIQELKRGTRPQYKFTSWAELRGMPREATLSDRLRIVYQLIGSGTELDAKQKAAASELVSKRLVVREGAHFVILPPPAPELAFIPNAFVCGAARETPPLERLRQAQDAKALRMAVDLYHTQNLLEDEGVSRNVFYKKFNRHKYGEFRQFCLWGFERDGQISAYSNHPLVASHIGSYPDDFQRRTEEERAHIKRDVWSAFWSCLQVIEDCGVIEWVPYLVEGDGSEAEIIHPLCWEATDSPEYELAALAHEAAVLMARFAGTPALRDLSSTKIGDCLLNLAPIPRHFQNVQLLGIARLRYRAHTKITSIWFGTRISQMEQHLATYKKLIEENNGFASEKNVAREEVACPIEVIRVEC